MLWRFFLAAVVVVSAAATVTAVAGLLQVNTLVQYLSVNPGIKSSQIKLPAPGKPQTLLLIGSDHRAGAPVQGANTDTMLLLRLNPASTTINVMSIPRDLEVQIPGYAAPQKLNAAYSEGDYGLLIKTIRANAFPDFYPNHVIDTNFSGFSKLVDAVGCVYSDVDHRYYNISQPAPSPDNYSSIDIQPGYQKLCGDNQSISGALPFVRFRHTDTDIVRNARQQDFLRWTKEQFPISKLIAERDKLLKIFGSLSTLDDNLRSENGLLTLFDLVAFSDKGAKLKQIPFPATIGPVYVTSTPAAMQASYRAFLRPTKAIATKAAPMARSTHRGHTARTSEINTAGLTADPADGRAQAAGLTRPGMPVYYPRLIKAGSAYCTEMQANCDNPAEPATVYAHSYPRQYFVPNQQGRKWAAWRMTLATGLLGEYYGIQGVAWRNPPLLASPSGHTVINGRELFLYAGNGGHLTTVAWHQAGNSYWVSNTLTSSIPNTQLINIAASMTHYR